MALVVNTNVASMSALQHLNESTNTLNQTFERLSSGLRINSASDDPAGLSVATKFSSSIRSLNQVTRNANDTISLFQVADGALEETVSALQRMRELAVQAANDTLVSSDRSDLQTEVSTLIEEIDRIANDTEFNKQVLLDGTFSNKKFLVGIDTSATSIVVSLKAALAGSIGVSSVSVGTISNATSALNVIDNALSSVSDIRATIGALQNRFESIVSNLGNVSENMSAALSNIQDADIAQETAALTRASILQQTGVAILAQANQQPQIALQLLS